MKIQIKDGVLKMEGSFSFSPNLGSMMKDACEKALQLKNKVTQKSLFASKGKVN